MKRREFIITSTGAVAASMLPFSMLAQQKKDRKLAAYYFLAGMYTLKPDSIRSELDEMASWGMQVVCIGVTSLALNRAPRNINFILEECHKRKMECHIVPSRIAGITAGAPISPSSFSQLNPDAWIKDKDGQTPLRKVGPICSFYHPKVVDYYHELMVEMLDLWDLDGIIWDEPKTSYWQDHSSLALKNNPTADFRTYMKDHTDFFSSVNKTIKDKKKNCTITFFDEAVRPDIVVEEIAKMKYLDYYGTDGKPWPREASPLGMEAERSKKVVPVYGERFFTKARKNGLKTMCLPENHNMSRQDNDLMEKHLPQILELDIDMWVYYYYGRNQEEPERNMQIIKDNIKTFKS
ncbi:MAG: hypothetical protein HRT61_09790 [Ekhidna sp.]|nr:hypothetical protein [Ekhidna sp.]